MSSTPIPVPSTDCLSGRGVRARVAVSVGEIIEPCFVVVVPEHQVTDLDRTLLYDYYFGWDNGAAALALGYGSLYNHSATPNADYVKDFDAGVVRIVATRAIAAGDEITVDYSRGGTNPLWFTPHP